MVTCGHLEWTVYSRRGFSGDYTRQLWWEWGIQKLRVGWPFLTILESLKEENDILQKSKNTEGNLVYDNDGI